MKKLKQWALIVGIAGLAAGCGGTSYGVSKDGTFPPKPAGADYPSWEHMCVRVEPKNISKTLNESGENGWEMVTMGMVRADTLMCFKRPAGAVGSTP